MYNQVKPRQGPARGPPHRNEVPKWDPTQEGRCQARPEPHPAATSWRPRLDSRGHRAGLPCGSALSPLRARSPRPPAAPVPHLHLLRHQQIFIEHVRLAPETQQGGEGGPGGVPSPSSCSRGGGRNENQHRSRETERSAARLGPNSAPGRAQSGCRGQGTPEDRAPHRTQTREARRGRGWGKPPCRGKRSRLL